MRKGGQKGLVRKKGAVIDVKLPKISVLLFVLLRGGCDFVKLAEMPEAEIPFQKRHQHVRGILQPWLSAPQNSNKKLPSIL
jgi:hypothetical protein